MSRYNLRTNDPAITAVIGWDPPLQTFFAQVERVNPDDEDDDGEMLVWEGTKFNQHSHLGFILPKLKPYCTVPQGMLDRLARDQASSTTPSPLQREMTDRFAQSKPPELATLA